MPDRGRLRTYLALVIFAFGCSSKTDGGGRDGESGGDDAPTAEEFAARVVNAVCDSLEPCCAAANLAYDRDACRAAASNFFPEGLLPPGYAVEWDPVQAERCVAAHTAAAASCTPSSALMAELDVACDDIYRPTLAAGQACQSSRECLDIDGKPATCMSQSMIPGEGVCAVDPNPFPTQHGGLGDPCSASCTGPSPNSCSGGPPPPGPINTACYELEGFRCDYLTQTCIALATLGQPCGMGCGGTTYCDGTTCVADKPDGAACSSSDECESGECGRNGCGPNGLTGSYLCSGT